MNGGGREFLDADPNLVMSARSLVIAADSRKS
jgi:hypothetical protein